MRISKQHQENRKNFVKSLFKNNPALSVKEVQEALTANFGNQMHRTLVLSLKEEVTGVKVAPRKYVKKAKSVENTNVFQDLGAVDRILEATGN